MIQNFDAYRVATQYEGVFKYIAPEGKHWESCGTNFGKVIWAGYQPDNPYDIVDDKDETKKV